MKTTTKMPSTKRRKTPAKPKPLILVTNDDGIGAPGLRHLADVMKTFGDVVVVAPNEPQSCTSHAMTHTRPLRLYESDVFKGVECWSSSGTPVDCVKLGLHFLEQKPDLVVSGINHGSNASIATVYSGTIAAAMEGAIEGIPSLAFSLLDPRGDADFSASRKVVRKVAQNVFERGLPKGTVLSVNVPALPYSAIQGFKVCRAAAGRWQEAYDERTDPNGRNYYWRSARFHLLDKNNDTDDWALTHGYVSVVPLHFDLTAHHAISQVGQMNWT